MKEKDYSELLMQYYRKHHECNIYYGKLFYSEIMNRHAMTNNKLEYQMEALKRPKPSVLYCCHRGNNTLNYNECLTIKFNYH